MPNCSASRLWVIANAHHSVHKKPAGQVNYGQIKNNSLMVASSALQIPYDHVPKFGQARVRLAVNFMLPDATHDKLVCGKWKTLYT